MAEVEVGRTKIDINYVSVIWLRTVRIESHAYHVSMLRLKRVISEYYLAYLYSVSWVLERV